jgi:hypothetical protein
MAEIVECPICDTKYNISSLKDGMKLKCTRCHKVVGTIKDGELLPLLEALGPTPEIKRPIAPRRLPILEDIGAESGKYEVIVKRKTPKAVEKPPLMLVLAGLTGFAAVITVAYISIALFQPYEMFKKPSKQPTTSDGTQQK